MSRLNEALKTLSELIKIPSVQGSPEPGAPFGTETLKALNLTLSAAEKLGFKSFSGDGYYGYAEVGEADKRSASTCQPIEGRTSCQLVCSLSIGQ